MSILKPDSSVMVGLAEGAAIYSIYQAALPTMTDIRAAQPHDKDVEASRKAAAWKSAGILGFVFLLTRDVNSFLIGGLALAGVDYMVKHSSGVHPSTGKLSEPVYDVTAVDAHPMPDYQEEFAEVY
jgi:hypothetical protein